MIDPKTIAMIQTILDNDDDNATDNPETIFATRLNDVPGMKHKNAIALLQQIGICREEHMARRALEATQQTTRGRRRSLVLRTS